jgi:hypothetical protein
VLTQYVPGMVNLTMSNVLASQATSIPVRRQMFSAQLRALFDISGRLNTRDIFSWAQVF